MDVDDHDVLVRAPQDISAHSEHPSRLARPNDSKHSMAYGMHCDLGIVPQRICSNDQSQTDGDPCRPGEEISIVCDDATNAVHHSLISQASSFCFRPYSGTEGEGTTSATPRSTRSASSPDCSYHDDANPDRGYRGSDLFDTDVSHGSTLDFDRQFTDQRCEIRHSPTLGAERHEGRVVEVSRRKNVSDHRHIHNSHFIDRCTSRANETIFGNAENPAPIQAPTALHVRPAQAPHCTARFGGALDERAISTRVPARMLTLSGTQRGDGDGPSPAQSSHDRSGTVHIPGRGVTHSRRSSTHDESCSATATLDRPWLNYEREIQLAIRTDLTLQHLTVLSKPWYAASDPLPSKSDEKVSRQRERLLRTRQGPSSYAPPACDAWGTPVPDNLPFQDVGVHPMNLQALPQNSYTQNAIDMLGRISVADAYATPLHHATASDACTAALHAAAVVEVSPRADGRTFGATILSAVPEKLGTTKNRYRIVADTLSANVSAAATPTQVTFCPMPRLLVALARMRRRAPLWFLSADLKTSFFQVPLPPHVRKCFAFKTAAGQIMQFARLPMGYKHSVDIMHSILQGLHAELIHRCPQLSTCLSDLYVDNILVASHDLQLLQRAALHLQSIADAANVTIGSLTISQSTEHRGVMLNDEGAPNDAVIQLKESFRQKLRYHCAVAMRNRISSQQFATLVGELTYADAIVMATPIREFYHLYHQFTFSQTRLSPAAKSELRKALLWLDRQSTLAEWFYAGSLGDGHHSAFTEASVSFSDASKAMLGNVSLRLSAQHTAANDITHFTTYYQCNNPLEINQSSSASELLGIVHMINRIPRFAPQTAFLFANDNTAAVRALARRFSSSLQLYTILRALHRYPRHGTLLVS